MRQYYEYGAWTAYLGERRIKFSDREMQEAFDDGYYAELESFA